MKRNKQFKTQRGSSNSLYHFIIRLPQKTRVFTVLFAGIIFLTQLNGCKDSGSVGANLPGSNVAISVDTLQVTGLQSKSLVSFSGNHQYFSAGSFYDPLFGNIKAIGLIKPTLPAKNDTLSFGGDTRMLLRLFINKNAVYGDTLSSTKFDLIELKNIFRGKSFRINDEVQIPDISNPGGGPISIAQVGSFTVQNEDSVDVNLNISWVNKYGTFYNSTDTNRDSSYVYNFYGLAIVAENTNKIVTFDPGQSKFIATKLKLSADADSTTKDSLSIDTQEWAYNLKRTNVPATDIENNKASNTLENVVKFNFDFSLDHLGTQNIPKLELVVYRDNLKLNQSIMQAGTGVVRPTSTSLELHYVDGDEFPQSIEPGLPLATGTYQSNDGAYHFNLAPYVGSSLFENNDSTKSFYITGGADDGAIRPTLLFNSKSGQATAPKVIISSINTENQ